MARLDLGLAQRALVAGFAVQLLALAVVTWILLTVVKEAQTNNFVQHVRTFARGVADGFEIAPAIGDTNQTTKLLDSVILTGEGVYAEFVDNGHRTLSALNHPDVSYAVRQYLDFLEYPGPTYFIALPINKSGHDAEVRMGFDKRPTLNDIAAARRRILAVLAP